MRAADALQQCYRRSCGPSLPAAEWRGLLFFVNCRYMRALLTPYSSEGLDPAWLEPAPKQVGGLSELCYERALL